MARPKLTVDNPSSNYVIVPKKTRRGMKQTLVKRKDSALTKLKTQGQQVATPPTLTPASAAALNETMDFGPDTAGSGWQPPGAEWSFCNGWPRATQVSICSHHSLL